MNQENLSSNAQSWELEVVCKNKQYMIDIVDYLSKDGVYNFGVEIIEYHAPSEDESDGKYIVFVSCSWFSNIHCLALKLEEIEKKHEKFD